MTARAIAADNKTTLNVEFRQWLAAALQAGAATVYTEDLQHRQLLRGSLRIVNPFLDTVHAH